MFPSVACDPRELCRYVNNARSIWVNLDISTPGSSTAASASQNDSVLALIWLIVILVSIFRRPGGAVQTLSPVYVSYYMRNAHYVKHYFCQNQ